MKSQITEEEKRKHHTHIMKSTHPDALTRKEIIEKTKCPPYTFDYLNQCGRLPVVARSLRRGIPSMYHYDSITIIIKHLVQRYKSN